MKFILYDPFTHNHYFLTQSLYFEFINRGFECTIINSLIQNIESNINSIFILIINPYFMKNKTIISTLQNINKTYKYKILYITEPITYIIEQKVYLDLINILKPYCLWTYNNFNHLKTYLNIFHIPPIYNESYNLTNPTIISLKEKINDKIVFIGNINENRLQTIEQFSDKIITLNNIWSPSEWTTILNKYLFYINIHRRNGCKSLETLRCIPILANGGVILSEDCNELDKDKYKDYNIYFYKKEDLLSIFLDKIKNIDYEEIYNKTILFRTTHTHNLTKYIDFHNNL